MTLWKDRVLSRYGGIGRHIGFKLRCLEREGSNPSIDIENKVTGEIT